MFNFTPLRGAQSDSPASQSLLELDGGVKVLIDVGWDERFDPQDLKEIERHVPTLSIILLTHATPAHLAGFAHCCKHFPLFTRIPVYATSPVISLGRTLLQDLYASTPLASTIIPSSSLSETSYSYTTGPTNTDASNILLPPPTPDEIATYFSFIHPLKFLQPHQPLGSSFSPSLNGLTITAYNAGHTLGGTIWHIQHGLESIVYAVDWNQARENVLSGAAWLGGAGAAGTDVVEQLRKPTALICSSGGAERVALFSRKRRDELLLDMIRSTVSTGGTVLIPTDSSARVLEIAYLLEHAWRADHKKLKQERQKNGEEVNLAKLYLAGRNIGTTLRYARSMIEWMNESVERGLDTNESIHAPPRPDRSNASKGSNQPYQRRDRAHDQQEAEPSGPFEFKYVNLLERKKQIDRILRDTVVAEHGRGKVILASDASLEWGFSKDVLRHIASDSRNRIILTQKNTSSEGGEFGHSPRIGQVLWRWWEESTDIGSKENKSETDQVDLVGGRGREIEFCDAGRVALEGNDLLVYQQFLATQRQLHHTTQSSNEIAPASAADAVEDDSSSSSSSSDDSGSDRQGKALNISATLTHSNRNKLGLSNEDLGINVLLRRKGIYDFDTRGKKGRERIFPFVTKRRRGDDFGELIRPEEYLKAEERDETSGQDPSGSPQNNNDASRTLGQKRKWDNAGIVDGVGRRLSNGGTKRRSHLKNLSGAPGGSLMNGLEGGAQNASEEDDESDDSDTAHDESRNLMPSKVVLKNEMVQVNMQITFIDFEGLHDKRSLQMLIPLIQPRKLILVHGMKNETLSLASDCRKLLNLQGGGPEGGGTIDVFTPDIGTTVDASVDTRAWTLKLSESLVKRLHWQKVRSLGVVHVTGLLEATPAADDGADVSHKKQKMTTSGGESMTQLDPRMIAHDSSEVMPTLDSLPANVAAATRSVAQPLHVGDLRLADLRKILQGTGHIAEFRGEGTLLVDGIVAVRKSGTGKIEVEAGGFDPSAPSTRPRGLEGSFYTVKRKIYEGLAVVAGG